MSKGRRGVGGRGQLAAPYIGTCPKHGKRLYPTRADAKQAAKRLRDGSPLNEYRCGDYWHIGTLPPEVRRGARDRSDIR